MHISGLEHVGNWQKMGLKYTSQSLKFHAWCILRRCMIFTWNLPGMYVEVAEHTGLHIEHAYIDHMHIHIRIMHNHIRIMHNPHTNHAQSMCIRCPKLLSRYQISQLQLKNDDNLPTVSTTAIGYMQTLQCQFSRWLNTEVGAPAIHL